MSAAATPGYSGKPLAAKLGFAAPCEVVTVNAPPGYRDWLGPLDPGVRFVAAPTAATGFVHVFATRRDELAPVVAAARTQLPPQAAVWVSWPKKAAKVPTDLTEDVVRELALPLGFVDVKVCAVTDTWSGLKLVVRKVLR